MEYTVGIVFCLLQNPLISAVFYFVGHGFEVNGQCYLLGVDAPADAHQPQHAMSMDWVFHFIPY